MMGDDTLLDGALDLHMHTSPDLTPRCLDDLEAAGRAADAGMRGILLKNHYGSTAERARVAEKVVGRIRVYGSLVLNKSVGGLNPFAVDTALRMGAREVFLPTLSAANHLQGGGASGGIRLEGSKAWKLVNEILELVRDHDAILGTGHLSKPEIASLVRRAKRVGVRKILVTHPEHPLVDMSAAQQCQLAEEGVFFERCYASTLHGLGAVEMGRIVSEIRDAGARCTVLTTDLGIAGYPAPLDGMRLYATQLLALGIRPAEIDLMIRENPRRLVD
jgi:hypothetical protein